jgi:hypothetical protein
MAGSLEAFIEKGKNVMTVYLLTSFKIFIRNAGTVCRQLAADEVFWGSLDL